MYSNLSPDSVDEVVRLAFENIRNGVALGEIPLNSETTFRFLFAWELGRVLGFHKDYRFEFERDLYSGLDTKDKFLDLLVWTASQFKVALEFKLPKATSKLSGSNSTAMRARICNDIARLSCLVQNSIENIKVGYFICATNEWSYLKEGGKETNRQYGTYHGTVYGPASVIRKGSGRNGIDRDLQFPNHEVRFEWETINEHKLFDHRMAPSNIFAWLNPIKVYA